MRTPHIHLIYTRIGTTRKQCFNNLNGGDGKKKQTNAH